MQHEAKLNFLFSLLLGVLSTSCIGHYMVPLQPIALESEGPVSIDMVLANFAVQNTMDVPLQVGTCPWSLSTCAFYRLNKGLPSTGKAPGFVTYRSFMMIPFFSTDNLPLRYNFGLLVRSEDGKACLYDVQNLDIANGDDDKHVHDISLYRFSERESSTESIKYLAPVTVPLRYPEYGTEWSITPSAEFCPDEPKHLSLTVTSDGSSLTVKVRPHSL